MPPLQSLDFPAFFGLSHLFPPRLSISVIFDTDLVTSQLLSADPAYTGTPSALSAKIDPDGSLEITPKKVTRLVLESVETLRENGILVKIYRSNGKRLISLRSAESADLPAVGKIDPIDPASRPSACAAP